MKRLASAALAGALAVGAVAATSATATADSYYPYHRHAHYYGGYGDDAGGYVAAGILGLATGLVASQVFSPAPPPYPYYASGYGADEAHIQWCESTYRSYNPETDLWRDYRGVAHQCQGPY